MARIRFITIRADRLAVGIVVTLLLLGVAGYLTFLGLGQHAATPVPKALLLRSIPASTTAEPPPAPAAVGTPAPNFTLQAAGGDNVSLSSYKGRPVLLYFWASWCSFCRDDMPGLQTLQDDNKDSGLAILTINLLEKEELIKSFAGQTGLKIPMLLDKDGSVSATYMVRATPTYMFIDKEGILRAMVVGRPRPAVFERNLSILLGGDNPQQNAPGTQPNRKRMGRGTPVNPQGLQTVPPSSTKSSTTTGELLAPGAPPASPGTELAQPKTGQAPGITGAPDISSTPDTQEKKEPVTGSVQPDTNPTPAPAKPKP